MKLSAKLENMFAAAAFAEQNQSETALQMAGFREVQQKRESAEKRKVTDARPRLRV